MIVDLDGTLFTIGDRSPYDADSCGLDTVNPVVLAVMQWGRAAGWVALLASGRGFKASHRLYTEYALTWNRIGYDGLFMRAVGDGREDWIVKREIYHRDIEPFYDTRLVLDDRGSVVRMWRALGLSCLRTDDRLD
jgi:hypothetical protein